MVSLARRCGDRAGALCALRFAERYSGGAGGYRQLCCDHGFRYGAVRHRALALWRSADRRGLTGRLYRPASLRPVRHSGGGPLRPFAAVVLWIITEHTPIGRCMYAVGGNPVAAALNGISVNRYIIGAFMTSSTLTGFTGVIIAAEQGVGGPASGWIICSRLWWAPSLAALPFVPPGERLGHGGRYCGAGDRYCGYPAVRRRVLGRTTV